MIGTLIGRIILKIAQVVHRVADKVHDVIETVETAVQSLHDMSPVEIKARLDKLAQQRGDKLDWEHSIVDLLKLIGEGSSLVARQQLASEFNSSVGADFTGTAEQNIWLHKQMLTEIGKHGIELPPCE